jgi:hypothetical protein
MVHWWMLVPCGRIPPPLIYVVTVFYLSVLGLITYLDDIQVIWAGYQILNIQNQTVSSLTGYQEVRY